MCVCVHICVWSTSGILSLSFLYVYLSRPLLTISMYIYQPLCFYWLRASHLCSFHSVAAEQRSDFECRNDFNCDRISLKRSRFELGCRGDWRERGGCVRTHWGSRFFRRLEIFFHNLTSYPIWWYVKISFLTLWENVMLLEGLCVKQEVTYGLPGCSKLCLYEHVEQVACSTECDMCLYL